MTSGWTPVTSGVPKGSVLGPVLFIIYMNKIDFGLNNFISLITHDTKIGNTILSESIRRSLQEELRKISDWSVKWEMPYNINKYQILQVGSRNIKNDYENLMNAIKIKSVHSVKDPPGVTVTSNQVFPAVQRVRYQSKQDDGFD